MATTLHIGLSAGEASGDQLGAALIRQVRQLCPDTRFSGIAGPQMRAAGCEAVARTEELSIMGLAEVLRHLPRLLRLRRRMLDWFTRQPPALFVSIDAPDFNLGLARRLRRRGIATLHWVAPAVWAWRRYRVRTLRNSVDALAVLFPFEVGFFRRYRVPVHYVGHPLADDLGGDCDATAARESLQLAPRRACIALLPGSRRSEVERLLPVFLRTALTCRQARPDLQFVLPAAGGALREHCRRVLAQPGFADLDVTLVSGRAREALCAADAVLLASGTATLECLLLRRPMVVAYRLHPLTYQLVRRLLAIPRVALPNLLLGRQQVPEFLQGAATAPNLAPAVLALLDAEAAARQVEPFAAVHRELRRDSARQVAGLVLERAGGPARHPGAA